jgi:PAS domain S-box-containing protein
MQNRLAPRARALTARLQQPRLEYVRAAAAVALATLVRLPFEGLLQGRAPYGLYYPMVMLVALSSGIGATVFAAALSLVAALYFFIPPAFSFELGEPGSLASTAIYAVTTIALVWLSRRSTAIRTSTEQSMLSARRLAAIVESSDDAIIGKDLDGVVQSWNAGAQRMYGYAAAEIIGRPITLLIPPDRQDEEQRILATLRRGEPVDHLETVRVAKDGTQIEVSVTSSPIHDTTGKVIGASKIARDITERRRAERALAQQREWCQVTLASIGDAVITTDCNGKVTFMNPVAERLTGWDAADAEGRGLGEVFRIIDESTREPIENPCHKVLSSGTAIGLAEHTVLIARDGSERPIDENAAPIRTGDGPVAGVVLVFHDVSDRRKGEREREELLESERTARGDAERANRLKDDFVATLSHELRTPLSAILGWTQMLRHEASDPGTLSRATEVIERNTRLLAQLISDLLDVSSIASGKMRINLQSVQLAALIEHAIETVKPVGDAKQVAIDLIGDAMVEPIDCDPARVQQIVWNLLSNAVKFSPKGSRVLVALAHDERVARITVSDRGSGISADFLPHLFDRFRQADASTTRRHGGLGLGLTIVKQLVEMHRGTVTARSDGEGKGATFVVTLPLDAGREELAPAERASEMPVQHDERARLRGLKVIVVEDEADARELVERLLSEAGCLVVAVESASAALAALGRERPDLLVSDIGLPDEDGYSLIQRIRGLETGQAGALPAIALTAFARGVDRTRALRAGFQAHLAKPVDPVELLAVVGSFAGIVARRPPVQDPVS